MRTALCAVFYPHTCRQQQAKSNLDMHRDFTIGIVKAIKSHPTKNIFLSQGNSSSSDNTSCNCLVHVQCSTGEWILVQSSFSAHHSAQHGTSSFLLIFFAVFIQGTCVIYPAFMCRGCCWMCFSCSAHQAEPDFRRRTSFELACGISPYC